MSSFDLAVIGAGEAGIAAALQAADLGGAVCLHPGISEGFRQAARDALKKSGRE